MHDLTTRPQAPTPSYLRQEPELEQQTEPGLHRRILLGSGASVGKKTKRNVSIVVFHNIIKGNCHDPKSDKTHT